jgi:hypothetical protein
VIARVKDFFPFLAKQFENKPHLCHLVVVNAQLFKQQNPEGGDSSMPAKKKAAKKAVKKAASKKK